MNVRRRAADLYATKQNADYLTGCAVQDTGKINVTHHKGITIAGTI